MRSTQLQTLRAVAAGADNVIRLVMVLGRKWPNVVSRLERLEASGHIERAQSPDGIPRYALTDRARALLEKRARLDGETMT